MKRLFPTALAATVLAVAPAGARPPRLAPTPSETLAASTDVLNELAAIPAKGIPPALLADELSQLPPPSSTHPRPELDTPYRAPGTDEERAVAEIWQEVFAIERIGIEDDFFELGGDSLVALQLVSRLSDAIGLELRVRNLFEAPTIAALAVFTVLSYIVDLVSGTIGAKWYGATKWGAIGGLVGTVVGLFFGLIGRRPRGDVPVISDDDEDLEPDTQIVVPDIAPQPELGGQRRRRRRPYNRGDRPRGFPQQPPEDEGK